MLLSFFSLLVDAGAVPPGNDAYPYFVSIQNGFSSALITCLLINGFVGFQLYEDGTPLSVWMLRVCSVVAFALSFLISLATFKDWAGMGPTQTVGLFTVLYLLNAIQLFVYIVLQIILVVRTLEDRWPLAAIVFGILFFVIGQVLLYGLSAIICSNTSHYIDGLFLATTCNLLAVMMVYKVRQIRRTHVRPAVPLFPTNSPANSCYQDWDSITKEDLEVSVGTRMNNWEVKELLPEDERRTTVYMDDPSGLSSAYDHSYSPSANRFSRY